MVVEDARSRAPLADVLRSRGHRVTAVADERAASEALDAEPCALVLLDLGAAGADRLDLCRRTRAHRHGAAAVIVVITGQNDPVVLQSMIAAGADDYVTQPVDVAVLDLRLGIAEREARRRREAQLARQRLDGELVVRNRELRTLYRIAEVTLATASPEGASTELIEEVCKATGFPIGAIERYDAAREKMIVTAACGIPLEGGALEIPAHETLSGLAVRTGQPVIESNPRARPEFANQQLRDLGIRTWMSFPMVVGDQVVGTLSLAHTDAIEPDRRLVRWAGSLANGVAQFLERVTAEEELRDSERRHRALAEQLQQANEELERFAYSVSHDLRAPLRTMQGFAHALVQNFGDRLPVEARDYAQRIIASGQQSEVLIRDLLAYSRLSFEQLEMQPVELSQVVAAARDQLEGDIRAAAAEIRVDQPLPTVLGQSTTLVQVVANLISNAIKFVPMGRRPELRIWAEPCAPFVRLRVEDNGIGVPPGQEERIFRVFERLMEGGAHPGTGIGLAIVRRGMERLGGRAGVEHNPAGAGSSFWIEIPAVEPSPRRAWGRKRRGGR